MTSTIYGFYCKNHLNYIVEKYYLQLLAMRIRQKKRAKIAKIFTPMLNSKPLSSRFSSETTDRKEDPVTSARSEDLLTKLQTEIELGHDITKVATSFDRSSVYSTENQNKTIQAAKEYQFAANKNREAKLLPVQNPEKEKKQSDRNFKPIGIAGFQGRYQPLFVEINDVEQGLIPNCYFLAQMAALARNNPDAMDKYINAKENGVYEVTIYVNSQPNGKALKSLKTSITLTLDDILPPSNFGRSTFDREGEINAGGKVQLLLMLIEKAYATYKGTYDPNLWTKPNEAISQLTGNNSDIYNNNKFNDKQVANIINSSLEKKIEVTTATSAMSDNVKEQATNINPGITEKTTYNIKKVDPISLTISLQNSLGSTYDITNLPISEFRRFFHEFRLRR